ncbi:MAG TPA: DNA-3-methyladenine glycosylase I [Leptolyngbyaceae cyanobacterium M65_K2018_010]|nr:DNA-3-methyladenine glycosylase I [Leptolyngbyaceae cyanobacterium M65_K2018_010]
MADLDSQYLLTAADDLPYYWWSGDQPDYRRYHDDEWGHLLTTAYAFMQAVGLVNDHLEGCWCHGRVETLGAEFVRPCP